MTTFSLRGAGIIILFLVGTCPAPGQQPQGGRFDRYGDALPEGVIARLGTLRLTHLGGIEAVAISPDGTMAASGVRHGKEKYLGERAVQQAEGITVKQGVRVTEATIRLWNVKTGELLRQLSTPDAPVSHIHFAIDGKTFFAGCGKFFCCWESHTGKKIWTQEAIVGGEFSHGVHLKQVIQAGDTLMSVHSGTIMCPVETAGGGVSFHYHPQMVARSWNARTGAPLSLTKTLQSTIRAQSRVPILLHALALTPDLKRAAIAVSEADPLPRDVDSFRDPKWKYPNSRVELIDLDAAKVVLSIANPDGEFGKLAIASDGSKVATLTGKTIETRFNENGHTGVRIDTRKDLWFASVDKSAKRVLAKGLAWVDNLAFVSEDRLAATDSEAKVMVWRLDTGAHVEKHDIRSESFEPACAAGVAVKAWENTVQLIDVKSGKPLHALDGHRSAPALRFAIHASDSLISRDGERAVFWDTRSWRPTQSVPMPKDEGHTFGWSRQRDAEFDRWICVERGLYLHKGERNFYLELRDIKTGNIVRKIDDGGRHLDYYFSPVGNRLISNECDRYSFFDVDTGKRLFRADDHHHPELSTHGKYFAKRSTGERRAIDLYDVDTGKLLRKLKPKFVDAAAPERYGGILKFKFSRDEQCVFGEVHELGGVENGISTKRVSVTVWKAATGEVLQDIVLEPAIQVLWRDTLSQSLVSVMGMSSDRRLVALTRNSGETNEQRPESTPIEIWEVASGAKRGELTGHGPIADLAFSPDNRCLASSSDDTTILIWDLNRPLQPVKHAARLTQQELDECWRTLFEPSAAKADSAIWKFIRCPDDSLPYLKKTLRAAPVPDAGRVRNLIANLDSTDFRMRTQADQELAKFGELIRLHIDKAIKEAANLELRRRLEVLAKAAQEASRPFGSMTRIGEWRALEILEKIERPQAIEVLRGLANGCPDGQLTIAAKDVLNRAETRAKGGQ